MLDVSSHNFLRAYQQNPLTEAPVLQDYRGMPVTTASESISSLSTLIQHSLYSASLTTVPDWSSASIEAQPESSLQSQLKIAFGQVESQLIQAYAGQEPPIQVSAKDLRCSLFHLNSDGQSGTLMLRRANGLMVGNVDVTRNAALINELSKKYVDYAAKLMNPASLMSPSYPVDAPKTSSSQLATTYTTVDNAIPPQYGNVRSSQQIGPRQTPRIGQPVSPMRFPTINQAVSAFITRHIGDWNRVNPNPNDAQSRQRDIQRTAVQYFASWLANNPLPCLDPNTGSEYTIGSVLELATLDVQPWIDRKDAYLQTIRATDRIQAGIGIDQFRRFLLTDCIAKKFTNQQEFTQAIARPMIFNNTPYGQ